MRPCLPQSPGPVLSTAGAFIPFRGKNYDFGGFACVKSTPGHKITRVGTDDAEGPVKIVREKISSSGLFGMMENERHRSPASGQENVFSKKSIPIV
jgi:hypothetical protein